MFKIYFSICFSILFIPVNAQQIGKQNFVLKNNLGNTYSYRTNNHNSVNTLACDTITTLTMEDTLTLYAVTSTVTTLNGGYVTGNNHYGDSALATFIPIDTSIIPVGAQMTGVIAVFYRYNNLGTNGTQTLNLAVFTGDTIHGPTTITTTTGTVTVVYTAPPIATATASLATISAITPTNNAVPNAAAPAPPSDYEIPYLFNFASPVTIPDSGFFISLQLPTTVGDTVVLLCSRNDSSHVNYAWDFGANGWRAFSNSNDWGLQTSLTLFPVICYSPVGIEQFEIENPEFKLYPNPTKDILNIEYLMAHEKTILIITDVLGNIIKQTAFSIQHSTLNISELNAGVYFVTVTDDKNNKTTKKLVIE